MHRAGSGKWPRQPAALAALLTLVGAGGVLGWRIGAWVGVAVGAGVGLVVAALLGIAVDRLVSPPGRRRVRD
ncbi:hypothetical protein FHX81_6831 [Saccharothrix saharensis]|uniref:Uncharacterized protein n=1 Tax=Saccharothrix saharensis TaxID=571190 RepID=A0A543JNG0_9PSEU|nr:hypothetical protein FHX81_6831 [Saccharothrix saharensis]